MHIPIDPHSDTPLYQQIEKYLRDGILSGNLESGLRLPATRKLAEDLGVNRITIESAYSGLEADGLIFSQVGRGTYVLPVCPLPEISEGENTCWPVWQTEIIANDLMSGGFLENEIISAPQQPHHISFSYGTGDSDYFPVEDFRKIINQVLRRDGIEALEYGEYNGYAPLRSTIAHILASQGLNAHPEHIIITSGSQQALSIVSQLLLKTGDTVLVESPTYAGALDLFKTNGYHVVGIACDENGMQVERLEEIIKNHPIKMIYCMPNFQNPTGRCLSSQRRRMLVSIADKYNIPILEDDFVGDLRYDGRAQPSLKALDPGGHVIYISTFSKMLMPGLRVGFLMTEGPILEKLVKVKYAIDISSSNLIQRALEAYLTVGRYQSHYRRSCQIYRKRRDKIVWAIQHYLPASVTATYPKGGFFIWLSLPEGLSSDELLPLAIEEGVSFAPGRWYFPEKNTGSRYLRLNFACNSPKEIEEGIRRLSQAIRRLIQKHLSIDLTKSSIA